MKNLFKFLVPVIAFSLILVSCRNDEETTPNIPVTGVTLSPATATLYIDADGPLGLTATVLPENATNRNVTWSSSNPAAATVENGIVTPVAEGYTTITVTTAEGDFSATSVITVSTIDIPVTGVSLDLVSATSVYGDALTLTATVYPSDATYQAVTWASSNPAVATVVDGVVTSVSVGAARITVTTNDGTHTASATISVVQTQRGCNTADPTWGTEGLGTITWGSMDNTDIETGTTTIPGTDERADQIWSAGVFAAACRDREEFEGGSEQGNVFASCRRANTEITGHFFSWCAIVRFADVLCPYPWRVPTTYDFSELDMNLGGTGNRRAGPGAANIIDGLNPVQQIAQWYLGATGTGATPEIGGIWQGARFTGTAVVPNANWSVYWSQSEGPNDQGIHFILNPGGPPMQAGVIDSGMLGAKFQGFVVRCVRN